VVLSYVKIKDCNANGSAERLNAEDNCVNYRNVTNILFPPVEWTNGGSNNLFTTAGNWKTGMVPSSTDRIELNGTANANLIYNSTWTVVGINVTSAYTGTLEFEKNLFVNGDITISSGTVVIDTQTITLSGDFNANGARITGAGTWMLAFNGTSDQEFTPGTAKYATIKASSTLGAVAYLAVPGVNS